MNRHDRLASIASHVQRLGNIRVDDVVETYGVSLATARRDLDLLAEQHLLVRTHGGASRAPDSATLPVNFRTGRAAAAKNRIAAAAATVVSPGFVVGLNGGTTTTQVARELAVANLPMPEGQPRLTIATNAVNIAYEMTVRAGIRVVVSGGVARAHTYELTGPLASDFFADLCLDVLFLGVDAIDERGGYATDDREAAVNQSLAAAARQVVVVADAEKLGQRAFARIIPAQRIDTLITDAPASHPPLVALSERGVTIMSV